MSAPPASGRRSRRRVTVSLAAVGVVVVAGLVPGAATASSHREAPLIAADPPVDNTDTYAFVSPDKPDTVTLVANWYPFQEPNGGPNFYPWATHAHYDINVDSDGDGKPEMTFRFQFHTQDLRDKTTFLYDNGPVTSLTDANLLFRQTYDLTVIRPGKDKTLITGAPVAPSDTGPASMPDYSQLRGQAIGSLPGGGGKVYVGQAADSFFLDLRVFDLLYGGNLKESGQNTLNGYNVNTVAIQVPKSYLALRGDATKNPVIGVWSDTERQSTKLAPGKSTAVGSYVQVSRLGNPLINEVVTAAGQKDGFNGSTPAQDATNNGVIGRVLKPEVPALIESIYGIKAPATPRNDLAEIFATGIAKSAPTLDGSKPPIQADLNSQILNKDVDPKKFAPAEELRLNMSVPVTANPNRLGVLAGDLQGFPNGRRLTDDVVDIELQALEGAAQTGKIVTALADGDGVNDELQGVRHAVSLRRVALRPVGEHPVGVGVGGLIFQAADDPARPLSEDNSLDSSRSSPRHRLAVRGCRRGGSARSGCGGRAGGHTVETCGVEQHRSCRCVALGGGPVGCGHRGDPGPVGDHPQQRRRLGQPGPGLHPRGQEHGQPDVLPQSRRRAGPLIAARPDRQRARAGRDGRA